MNWSLRIARVAGTDIKLHWSFALAVLYVVSLFRPTDLAGYAAALLVLVGLFGCVTLHELGHSTVAQRLGIPVHDIVLWPLGGFALLTRQPSRPLHELLIYGAGPFVNIVLAILAYLWLQVAPPFSPGAPPPNMLAALASYAPQLLFDINITLAAFNLIPAYPLDGGRMLRAGLVALAGERWANPIMIGLSWLLAAALAAFGLLSGDTLLVVMAVLIALFAGTLDKRLEQAANRGLGYVLDRGYVHLQNGDAEAAIRYYDRAIARNPRRALSFNNRGYAAFLRKDYRAAIADYTEALRLKPELIVALANRGNLYRMTGQKTLALADFDRLVELQPTASSLQMRAYGYTLLRDYDRAMEDLERALAMAPNNAWLFIARGYCLLNRSEQGGADQALALADFERAAALAPTEAVAINNRGFLRWLQGDSDAGLADIERALELAPDMANAYVARSSIRLGRGDAAGALSDMSRAIALAPDEADTYVLRGGLYFSLGDTEAARADAERAVSISPEDALLHSEFWLSLHARGQAAWAEAFCARAIELLPGSALPYIGRGDMRRANGDHAAAVADYTQAVALDADRAEAFLGRARSLQALGRAAEAAPDLRRVLELSDNAFMRRLASEMEVQG